MGINYNEMSGRNKQNKHLKYAWDIVLENKSFLFNMCISPILLHNFVVKQKILFY